MQNSYSVAFNSFWDKARSWATDFAFEDGPRILIAVLIMGGGLIIAFWLRHLTLRALGNKDLEPPLKMLISRAVRLAVIIFAVIIALGAAGINVTALVASISVAGLGIGLAMQGVLTNLVAGLTIIFTKPFRVGEYIELNDVGGQVKAIHMFSTTLQRFDLTHAVVPNWMIVNEVLLNHGEIRQLNLQVGIAYDSNLHEALNLVQEILTANPRVLRNPAPAIGVSALAESSIHLAIRPWTNLGDFGPAHAEIYRTVVERFRASRIEIPPPQREVRVLNTQVPKHPSTQGSTKT